MSGSAGIVGGARLGRGRRFGFGIGGFGFNLLFQTAALLLMFYYTDILGLSPATAGYVFAGALIWDAVFDPFIGYVANRTRTRWGRYRPYLLVGAVPLALSWALIFLPTGLEGAALVVFAVVAHVLFRTCYAIVNMPFLAMSATITPDSQERGVLAGLTLIFGAISTVFSSLATLKLVAAFGGGQPGFFLTAILYGTIAAIVFVIVFASTQETVVPVDEPHPTARDMVRMILSNRAFWIVSTASLLTSFGSTFFQKTLPYYFKYQFGREDLIPAALGVLALSVTLSVPLWTWVMKRTSKRTMWLIGSGVGLSGSLLLWVLPLQPGPTLFALVPLGSGVCAGFLGFWSAMPDTVEYGEWRSGVRAEGAVFGFVSLIGKTGLGLAAAALGELLTIIGYRPNVAQTPETLASMRVVMVILPGVLAALAGLVIAFYPLDGRTHARMLRVIAWRRDRTTRR